MHSNFSSSRPRYQIGHVSQAVCSFIFLLYLDLPNHFNVFIKIKANSWFFLLFFLKTLTKNMYDFKAILNRNYINFISCLFNKFPKIVMNHQIVYALWDLSCSKLICLIKKTFIFQKFYQIRDLFSNSFLLTFLDSWNIFFI